MDGEVAVLIIQISIHIPIIKNPQKEKLKGKNTFPM